MKRIAKRLAAVVVAVAATLGVASLPASADTAGTGGLLGGGHKYVQPGRNMNHNETFVSDDQE